MRFRFRSTWFARADPARVWEVLSAVEHWPQWWPGVEGARVVRPGDATHHGQRTALVVRSPVGYRLRFGVELDGVTPARSARTRVVGDLAGLGTWHLSPCADGVEMVITWDVRLRRPLLRALAPVAAPLFSWAHAAVMASGQRGLARVLAG